VADSTVHASATVNIGPVASLHLGHYVDLHGASGQLPPGTTCTIPGGVTDIIFDPASRWTLDIAAPLVPSAGTYRLTVTRDGSFTATADVQLFVDKIARGFTADGGYDIHLIFGSDFDAFENKYTIKLYTNGTPLPSGNCSEGGAAIPFVWEIRMLFVGP
jgi:hypothetical protein